MLKKTNTIVFILLIGINTCVLSQENGHEIIAYDSVSMEILSWGLGCGYDLTAFAEGFNICNDGYWTLVFQEDFSGDELNMSLWKEPPYAGALYNSTSLNQEYNTLSNAIVSEGSLRLVAKREDITARACSWKPDDMILEDGCVNLRDYHYTSAQLWTKPVFSEGIIEAKIKMPKGKGFWPAFWMFTGQAETGSDSSFEIDVFEFWNERDGYGSFNPSLLSRNQHMNLHHFFGTNHEDCSTSSIGVDYSSDFHIFAVRWERNKIVWFVDGVPVREQYCVYSVLGQEVGCYIQPYQQYIYNTLHSTYPMSIILSFNIQNKSENNGVFLDESPDDTTLFPSQLEVQWIRYYQRNSIDDVVVANQSQYPLINKKYNTIVGSNVTINCDYYIPEGQFLCIAAEDRVSIAPGFHADSGSYLHIKSDTNLFERDSDRINPHIKTVESSYDEKGQKYYCSTERVQNGQFNVSPNPNKGSFTLLFENDMDCIVKIYDIYGRLVHYSEHFSAQQVFVNLSDYPKGIYALQVYNKQKNITFTEKIIIQ